MTRPILVSLEGTDLREKFAYNCESEFLVLVRTESEYHPKSINQKTLNPNHIPNRKHTDNLFSGTLLRFQLIEVLDNSTYLDV